MDSVGGQQFLRHAIDSQLDLGLCFDCAIPTHLNISPKTHRLLIWQYARSHSLAGR